MTPRVSGKPPGTSDYTSLSELLSVMDRTPTGVNTGNPGTRKWRPVVLLHKSYSTFQDICTRFKLCLAFVSQINAQVSSWRHQMETFSALLVFCAGNSPVTAESPHEGQWRGALMISLNCVWKNGWTHNRDAGETPLCSLWRHCNTSDVYRYWNAWYYSWYIQQFMKGVELYLCHKWPVVSEVYHLFPDCWWQINIQFKVW